MKCKKCHTEMNRTKYGDHNYGYTCPKCGNKVAIPEEKQETNEKAKSEE